MLTLLNLKDFVIVEELTVEACGGLTCLTGETGAGKSILIDALELVLGARSDTSLIREGAQHTEVTAEFSVEDRAATWLQEAMIDFTQTVLLRRTVDTKGRSRCWINGIPASVAQMHELGERLVDIHGQHAHQSLLHPAYQLRLLDGFAHDGETLEAVRQAWETWQDAAQRLQKATQDKEKLQAEAERLAWTAEILEELNPKEGEWQSVSEEHAVLANAADIVESVKGALENLREGETNAARLVSLAEGQLTHASKFDATYAEYAKALSQAGALLEEVAHDAARHLEHCNMDDERFAQIDDRLNAFWRISRKFHREPEALVGFWNETKARLQQIAESADLEGLQRTERQAWLAYEERARALSAMRKKAALTLSNAVTEQMQRLAMTGGRLEVVLQKSEPWAGGLERCEFAVSGHAGATPRALTKVASGGELSRISLAIAVITAQLTPVPTLIFDEVDSGIGGAVAQVVGQLLRTLGRSRQVLCVTHLAQVASCADHQWQVSKTTSDGTTRSTLRTLTDEERIEEIARMLGGLQLTEATRCTAREMLEGATHA